MRARAALACILVCACYRPEPQEGVPCSEQGQCPTPLVCSSVTRTCVADRGDLPDAAPADAIDAPPDATPVCPPGSRTFATTGEIVSFTLPGSSCLATVRIEAWGAQGGDGLNPLMPGGKGAYVAGTFELAGGAMLRILVGGQGLPSTNLTSQRAGSGGGGSFVVDAAGAPLVVAGGGGGGVGGSFATAEGGPGQAGPDGQPGGGTNGAGGGKDGAGGGTYPNTGYHSGTGGGGLLGSGLTDSNGDTTRFGTPNTPGVAFKSGGAGGKGGSEGRNGGFGGGGAAGYTGGGGGGYSGGGSAASSVTTYSGGGGGSFNAGISPVSEAGQNPGDGRVTITW
jgi:hypothetical protein